MSKIVLGGGLSGLSAAYYLEQKFPKEAITLIEATSRTGGWIKSNIQENGTIFEQGPRTIRPKGPSGANTLHLIEELSLGNQIVPIVSTHPAAINRLIYANRSLHLLPSSLSGLFKKQKLFSKPLIFHLLNDLKAKKKEVEDESIYEFTKRRFGPEVADYLISPMICGICAGNAKEISVNFLMSSLFSYEQNYGSISGGLLRNFTKKTMKTKLGHLAQKAKEENWSIYSFTNGCETLPLALKDSILQKGVQIKLNTRCTDIRFDKNQVILQLSNNEVVVADHLISSIPSNTLGALIEKDHPDLALFAKNLVKNVSVAVVNLEFKENCLENPAFGLLVAPKENLPILGIIYDSCCFPKTSCGTVLTVMMGGYWFEKYFGTNPSEQMLLEIALHQVKNILKIGDIPTSYKVNILTNCIPQYIVGHTNNLKLIKDYIKAKHIPISLCGASYYGVGINDVILSAKNAVDELK